MHIAGFKTLNNAMNVNDVEVLLNISESFKDIKNLNNSKNVPIELGFLMFAWSFYV